MKDLFDTLQISEHQSTRSKRRARKTREERDLESEALFDAMGGTYSDRSFFDLDHAIAASGRSVPKHESFEEFDLASDMESDEY